MISDRRRRRQRERKTRIFIEKTLERVLIDGESQIPDGYRLVEDEAEADAAVRLDSTMYAMVVVDAETGRLVVPGGSLRQQTRPRTEVLVAFGVFVPEETQ